MELKHLRFFVAATECGSIMQAAEKLYTTQPNVSKVIKTLEKELGCVLFQRTNHGLIPTAQGRRLYAHAKTVLRNAEIMLTSMKGAVKEQLSIASYPSNMISRMMTDFYRRSPNHEYTLEYLEGSTEDVIEYVERYRCELGILYIGQNQMGALNHWLWHKKLEFHSIAQKAACIYVGPHHPFYHRETITAAELAEMKFIQPSSDYFSVEKHLEPLDPSLSCIEGVRPAVSTNSDHAAISFLLHTDLCSFGIDLMNDSYLQYDIHPIHIEGAEKNLHIGFVQHIHTVLSKRATEFSELLTGFVNAC